MKNLKGSATWKNVDTISFGGELFVQLHEGRVTAPTARPENKLMSTFFQVAKPSQFLIEGVSLA